MKILSSFRNSESLMVLFIWGVSLIVTHLMCETVFCLEKRKVLCCVFFWYPIVKTSKNRTGYGQAAVVLGLGQYTIAMNTEKTVCSKKF